MILKNRRTREKIELTRAEFEIRFANEIRASFQSYSQTERNKAPWLHKCDSDLKSDYNSSLQWNFNNFGISAWYIERM